MISPESLQDGVRHRVEKQKQEQKQEQAKYLGQRLLDMCQMHALGKVAHMVI
jgi:hypothetical protein